MTTQNSRFARLAGAAAFGLALLLGAPSLAAAQDQTVYGPSDLTKQPRIANQAQVSRILSESYPELLKRQHVEGAVQLEFVIEADGKVDPSSVQVIVASPVTLAAAAKQAIVKFPFKPGEVNGQPVRARVQIPLVYKAG